MYGTCLTLNIFNNIGTRHLNEPKRLFHLFCCNTRRIFELLHVHEPGFNTDKYGTPAKKIVIIAGAKLGLRAIKQLIYIYIY